MIGDSSGNGEDSDEEDEDVPLMTVAEIVSELMYAGKSLSEIAGYDSVQLAYVIFKKRDSQGRLVRGSDEYPPGVYVDDSGQRIVKNPCSLKSAFHQVSKKDGLTRKQAMQAWRRYLAANPELVKVYPEDVGNE